MIEKYDKLCDKILKYSLLLFDRFENSNISSFKEVFCTFNGGTFKSSDYVSISVNKLITIKNVDDNGFNTSNVSFLANEQADKKYELS